MFITKSTLILIWPDLRACTQYLCNNCTGFRCANNYSCTYYYSYYWYRRRHLSLAPFTSTSHHIALFMCLGESNTPNRVNDKQDPHFFLNKIAQ